MLSFSTMLAMAIFALTMSITPGPVNMVILSSGTTHGVRATHGFIWGAVLGFIALLLTVSIGLMQLINSHPLFLTTLTVVGTVFLVYVGLKIARSTPAIQAIQRPVPNFGQGALLQWLNPKAWIACASGVSLFSQANTMTPIWVFAAIYLVVCYLSLLAWAIVGAKMRALLNQPRYIRWFNQFLGAALIVSALWMLWQQLFMA
ncbi:MAG: LysE family translocator [Neisseriaceae bacterium]|nr:LysE family translocator [Neisseriaceae bacterium]MBP6860829.1 LysE family translocator [Neisseriaceae bacterium]